MKEPQISIAVPGSVIANVQTQEQAMHVVGLIGRCAAIYRVKEIICFEDNEDCPPSSRQLSIGTTFLARLLLYMETPQYLRKALFPLHPDYKHAGKLPPLAAAHHLLASEWAPFREGVVTKPLPGNQGCHVDVGLDLPARLPQRVDNNRRVTTYLGSSYEAAKCKDDAGQEYLAATLAPRAAIDDSGLYWGYHVRIAHSMREVLAGSGSGSQNGGGSGCGQDLVVGTSEHGQVEGGGLIQRALEAKFGRDGWRDARALVVFGGPEGLEGLMEREFKGGDAGGVFDQYVNVCPNQGSKTIRTEEAVFVCMAVLTQGIWT